MAAQLKKRFLFCLFFQVAIPIVSVRRLNEPRCEKIGFFAYAKTKTQNNCAFSAFVFATRIVQSIYYLNPKFQTSSHSVAVQPGLCQTWSETPTTGFLTTRLKSANTSVALLHKQEERITKTRLCNILQFFTAVKIS